MIRLNLFMIWFLHFLSLLSVICRYYRQNSSSRIIVVLVYTVSTFLIFVYQKIYNRFCGSQESKLFDYGYSIKTSNCSKD